MAVILQMKGKKISHSKKKTFFWRRCKFKYGSDFNKKPLFAHTG
jgi:hypothetical protein